MKVTSQISEAIERYEPGDVFAFNELGLDLKDYSAGTKALSRMIENGILNRASTGKYYKPNNSPFGALKPAEDQLLRTYLFDNGKRIAYITGPSLYNRLNLTTQVPKTVHVASRDKRITTKVGNLKVKPVKSYVDVTDSNYQVLGLLDAIKDFREIPDRNTESALIRIRQLLKNLTAEELEKLVEISLKYPPRARSLAGALLDSNGDANLTAPIAATLNPLSSYTFAISKNLLPEAEKWNIN